MEPIAWLALKSRMDAFTEAGVDIAYVDSGYTPQATKPYLFVQFVPTAYQSGVVDPNCGEDYRGILNVSVFTPTSWTMAQHLGLSGRVAAWLSDTRSYPWIDYVVKLTRKTKIISQPRLDGAHNRVEVQAYWRIWG